jgi:hypothetical protein
VLIEADATTSAAGFDRRRAEQLGQDRARVAPRVILQAHL